MRQVNIHEAKTKLSELIAAVEAGEEVVIARAGKPIVRLVPIEPVGPRMPGLLKGLIVPDALFDPLLEDEAAHWE